MTGHPTGVRRILDNAADRAMGYGPPSRRAEALGVAVWSGLLASGVGLVMYGRHLSRR